MSPAVMVCHHGKKDHTKVKLHPIRVLADLKVRISAADLPSRKRRDLISSIDTVSEMLGRRPEEVSAAPCELRPLLRSIRPAAHEISPKTLSNVLSLLVFAMKMAGQIDPVPRGLARQHNDWRDLINALYLADKATSCALAAFASWCAFRGLRPADVTDRLLQEFHLWLEERTLHPSPKNLVRQIPIAWARARNAVKDWPQAGLARISFKGPQLRMRWEELPTRYRMQAKAYLDMRLTPDLFDDSSDAPSRALAVSTVRQQREHLRIAASILIREHGINPDDVTLPYLVTASGFKSVLRSLVDQATKKHRKEAGVSEGTFEAPPNAFVICLATTLIQIARYYVKVQRDELLVLKKLKSKLKPVPLDLTEKNMELLRKLEVPATQARLMFLPELLHVKVRNALKSGRVAFVDAQVSLAIDLQLVLPLRPQNLHALHWQRHFMDMGAKRLRLIIPRAETKSKKRDIVADVPAEISERLDWYRRIILPKLKGSETGHLFVKQGGQCKDQKTLAGQIIDVIATHVGVHMTPHQFRHFAAVFYLDNHPNDFETVRNLLGHAYSKTTAVYAGSSVKRAGIAYARFLFERKDELRASRGGKRRRPTLTPSGSGVRS